MVYRLISAICLIALIISLIGCGGKKIPVTDEAQPASIKIEGFTYKSGEYQRFINQDAVYNPDKNHIWGQIEGGKNVFIKLVLPEPLSALQAMQLQRAPGWYDRTFYSLPAAGRSCFHGA